MKRLLLTTAFCSAALVGNANADAIKFFNGSGTSYDGPFEGSGTVNTTYQQVTAGGLGITCPTGSNPCSSGGDVQQNTETFGTNAKSTVGITATAKDGTNTVNVWGDFNPNFGGLGVGSSGDDNIGGNGSEVLHLAFGPLDASGHGTTAVTLSGIATLFDSTHNPFGIFNGGLGGTKPVGTLNDFLWSTDGTNFNQLTFYTANNGDGGANNLGCTVGLICLSGTDFYFKEDGASQPEFYISGLTYDANTITTHGVPGPIVGAGLPGLIAGCFTMLGLGKYRRRRRNGTV